MATLPPKWNGKNMVVFLEQCTRLKCRYVRSLIYENDKDKVVLYECMRCADRRVIISNKEYIDPKLVRY